MRIAVAEIAQETDSFSPLRAGLSEFESYGLFRGAEIVEKMVGAGPIGGLLEVVSEQAKSVELVPLLRAWGGAGGAILDTTFAQFRQELTDRLRAAGPVDAVFLALHGAAATESEDDLEGIILEDVRRLVGGHIPIVVPFDHHANMTRRIMTHATCWWGMKRSRTIPWRPAAKRRGCCFGCSRAKSLPCERGKRFR